MWLTRGLCRRREAAPAPSLVTHILAPPTCAARGSAHRPGPCWRPPCPPLSSGFWRAPPPAGCRASLLGAGRACWVSSCTCRRLEAPAAAASRGGLGGVLWLVGWDEHARPAAAAASGGRGGEPAAAEVGCRLAPPRRAWQASEAGQVLGWSCAATAQRNRAARPSWFT